MTEAGDEATGFAVGDAVAVGNIVDACGECAMCLRGQENFCRAFPTLTCGAPTATTGPPRSVVTPATASPIRCPTGSTPRPRRR